MTEGTRRLLVTAATGGWSVSRVGPCAESVADRLALRDSFVPSWGGRRRHNGCAESSPAPPRAMRPTSSIRAGRDTAAAPCWHDGQMAVHPQAAAFDNVASEYEQGRPGYPRSILDWLGSRGALSPSSTIVDLGAGTGKLTRVLVESGARVIAIEPLAAMREEFKRILPDVELIDATAESMPLPDGSADLLTCGTAIHWFANDTALGEIARFFAPAGSSCWR